MGIALGRHPLDALIVTIAGRARCGAAGLILAAPVTAAVTRISTDLSDARTEAQQETRAAPAAAGAG
jgi:predicted PurR-regulated permease PerM